MEDDELDASSDVSGYATGARAQQVHLLRPRSTTTGIMKVN